MFNQRVGLLGYRVQDGGWIPNYGLVESVDCGGECFYLLMVMGGRIVGRIRSPRLFYMERLIGPIWQVSPVLGWFESWLGSQILIH